MSELNPYEIGKQIGELTQEVRETNQKLTLFIENMNKVADKVDGLEKREANAMGKVSVWVLVLSTLTGLATSGFVFVVGNVRVIGKLLNEVFK